MGEENGRGGGVIREATRLVSDSFSCSEKGFGLKDVLLLCSSYVLNVLMAVRLRAS